MKITFIILHFSLKPVGGYAVIYEYANQMTARGHEVVIVHPRPRLNIRQLRHPLRSRVFLRLAEKAIRRSEVLLPEVPWYSVDSRVKLLQTPQLTARYIPDGDALFGYFTEGEDYPPGKGKRFTIILGYGVGIWPQAQEDAFWRESIPKIVIARWLYDQGLNLGIPAEELIYIPIGIDHSKYRIIVPIDNRPPRVAMLYHRRPSKGSEDGIKALELARRGHPALEAVLFGAFPRPKMLPDWIEYHCGQPTEELVGSTYNGSSIYLCPSWMEGWHLPPAEAMACGCAVVSTDIGGVRDFAEHEVTALLSSIKDPDSLAANLLRLLRDDELRIRLAKAGYERMQEFTWERSTDLLEQFVADRIGWPSRRGKCDYAAST